MKIGDRYTIAAHELRTLPPRRVVMAFPRMVRVRQTFPRPRVGDIPRTVAEALGAAATPIKRGDTVAVGAGSRGIASIGVIVGAAVRWLQDLGARPFVFPAMGSHGGGTPEGQLSVLEHYGITAATMGCPVRATMDVVQVGEALGLPVWLDRHAADADWIGLVNRVKPHTDFKGSIESGLFKMMTIGLGKYKGAIQYHRANIRHGYDTAPHQLHHRVRPERREDHGHVRYRPRGDRHGARLHRAHAARGRPRDPHPQHPGAG